MKWLVYFVMLSLMGCSSVVNHIKVLPEVDDNYKIETIVVLISYKF